MAEHHEHDHSESTESQGWTWRRLSQMSVQLVAVAVVLALIFFAWQWLHHSGEAGDAHSRVAQAGPPPEVGILELQSESVPLARTFFGQTEATQTVEIRARIEGFLDERLFREGATVEADQLLFLIDQEPFQADVAVAEARLKSAQASQAWEQSQVNRFEQLVTEGAGTPPELEEQQSNLEVAKANVSLAEAQLRQAQLELGYTEINSPIKGLIGESLHDVGSYVNVSNGLLAVVEQVDPIYVTFAVSEQEWLRIRREREAGRIIEANETETEVRITLTDGEEYEHHGIVNFVSTEVDTSTSSILIRATVPNPDGLLKPGQFVRVMPLGFERTNVVIVPKGAVQQTPTGASVYVVDDANTANVRPVTLGEWTEHGWIIESGLEPGDRVVVDGIMMVRPGMPVKPAAAL